MKLDFNELLLIEEKNEKYMKEAREKIDIEFKKIPEEFNKREMLKSGVFLEEIINSGLKWLKNLAKVVTKNYLDTLVGSNKLIHPDLPSYIVVQSLGLVDREEERIKIVILKWAEKRNMIDHAKNKLKIGLDSIREDIEREVKIRQQENILEMSGIKKHLKRDHEKASCNKILKDKYDFPMSKIGKKLNFIDDQELKKIIIRDVKDVIICINNKQHKPVLILIGGILEGILDYRISLFKKEDINNAFEIINKARTDNNLNRVRKNSFEYYIEVSRELEIISSKATKVGHNIRDYRNLIHPQKEL